MSNRDVRAYGFRDGFGFDYGVYTYAITLYVTWERALTRDQSGRSTFVFPRDLIDVLKTATEKTNQFPNRFQTVLIKGGPSTPQPSTTNPIK